LASTISLVAGLHAVAQSRGARCALTDGERSVTYEMLVRNVAGIAAALRAGGVANGDRVALILPNSIEYVTILYGIMQAGAIAVPLNTAARPREIIAWLGHCEPRVVLYWGVDANARVAVTQYLAIAATSACKVLPIHVGTTPQATPPGSKSLSDLLAPFGSVASAAPGPQDSDPAMIIYTSGTTGAPKGVTLTHGNLASNTAAIISYLRLASADCIVTVLPFFYSYGNSVLHTHLQAGARMVLEQNLMYPHAVIATMAKERATGLAGVPSTFALLLARVTLGDYDLTALRYVTQAGGAMSVPLTEKLRAALPHAELFIMYGQTEASARLTYLPPPMLEHKLGSVGIPIQGVELQIRTEAGMSAASGEVGEVWARGPNVMAGYWRDLEATRAVLQDGWLRTGDMGYVDTDGYLWLVGRRADMIKVGANRVHPADIEEAISELDGVREVAVVGMADPLLGQAVKAFVVLREDAHLTPLQIQAHCRERLAAYKVPRLVVLRDQLPKTASGKIRRAELVNEG
jgi:acyl-CoA synthetase (AMP-forming)/AMP-acid ligase II